MENFLSLVEIDHDTDNGEDIESDTAKENKDVIKKFAENVVNWQNLVSLAKINQIRLKMTYLNQILKQGISETFI